MCLYGQQRPQPGDPLTIAAIESFGQIRDLRGRTGLMELWTEMAARELIIGPDTGALHLAAALCVPVIGLYFGGALAVHTGPYTARAAVLQNPGWTVETMSHCAESASTLMSCRGCLMLPLAEFEILPARSGEPTALHVPTGVLLHSRIDPAAEARDISQQHGSTDTGHTVILGGGLGYLPEAVLASCGETHTVTVIEPDVALYQLARAHRPSAPYFTSPQVRIIRAATLSAVTNFSRELPGDATLLIAPYLLRLAQHEHTAFAGFLHILRAEQASRSAYESVLPVHEAANSARLTALPRAVSVRLAANKPIIVVGAGPSLDACTDFLRIARESVTIVAASGAVPPLQAMKISPDWIIALEGRDTVLADLADVPASARVIVFPATHPAAIARADLALYSGEALETRGGSSAIPALDFALSVSSLSVPVALVGLDLGHQNGAYARAANREINDDHGGSAMPPKFLSMRAGLERILGLPRALNRRVFHVLDGGLPLRGTEMLHPASLPSILETTCVTESQRDA